MKDEFDGTSEVLDVISEPEERDCAYCYALQTDSIIEEREKCILTICPICGDPVIILKRHGTDLTLKESSEIRSLAKKFRRLDPNLKLSFKPENSNHFAVHITTKERGSSELVRFKLSDFWFIYVRFFKIMREYLKEFRPEAIYRGRILPDKAKGFELFDIWESLSSRAQLSPEGLTQFRKLSLAFYEVDKGS